MIFTLPRRTRSSPLKGAVDLLSRNVRHPAAEDRDDSVRTVHGRQTCCSKGAARDDRRGTGSVVPPENRYREAHLAMELVAESGALGSMDVVEVNPILDHENETAKLAVELVASALGARIL